MLCVCNAGEFVLIGDKYKCKRGLVQQCGLHSAFKAKIALYLYL